MNALSRLCSMAQFTLRFALNMLALLLQLLPLQLAVGEKLPYVATSTHDMARVLEGEDDLLNDLHLYVEALECKMNTTRAILDEAIARQQQIGADLETYVANPLVSFPLMRRMHMDARKIVNFLKQDFGEDLQMIAHYRLNLISSSDLEQAAHGFLRIQNTYNMDERDMAEGWLGDQEYDARLNTADCLVLAQHLQDQGDHEQAMKWLQVAQELYDETPDLVHDLLQNHKRIRELVKNGLSLDNVLIVRSALEQLLPRNSPPQDKQETRSLLSSVELHIRHLQICRGHSRTLASDSLRCFYEGTTSPFLQLAPLKLEQLIIEPHVVLCHEATSPEEQELLIKVARPKLRRAKVGQGKVDEKRFAMDAPVDLSRTEAGRRIRQRLEDMSGFDLVNSDQLTVLNYGLGGQHALHFDCWHPKDDAVYGDYGRNRIASILLYLTDVAEGGRTSFPALDLGVQPSQGSALIWHNMDDAAECDERSLHGACPVLLGNRWVATQWIQLDGQWSRKTCPTRGKKWENKEAKSA